MGVVDWRLFGLMCEYGYLFSLIVWIYSFVFCGVLIVGLLVLLACLFGSFVFRYGGCLFGL